MKFEVLEHTADIGFRAWGDSWADLLASSAMALVSIYLDPETVQPERAESVDLAAEDRETFLVSWLNEVLYLVDGRGFAIHHVEVIEAQSLRVRAKLWGEDRTERHPAKLIVKGVTYHQLKIHENDARWWCEVYLDI